MRVIRFDSASAFRDTAFPFLEEHEVEHNVILGITERIAAGGTGGSLAAGDEPAFWLVEGSEEGLPLGAALQTPLYDLALSLCARGAASALADAIAGEGRALHGVHGPIGTVDELVETWTALTGDEARLVRCERIYELTEVQPPSGVSGTTRATGPDDRELLTRWLAGFAAESQSPTDATVAARSLAEEGGGLLWLDPEPVSLAASPRRTRRGAAVAPVYTPHGQRGRGYASAVTAELSRQLLDSGCEFCCLYTDLGNETANRIYQRIGYHPVLDIGHHSFVREPASA